jgi:hypothetical protein
MDNYITLQLLADDGSPIDQECMIIGVFDVEGQNYIALAPTDDNETVLIYGYREVESEQFQLFDIEDEDTFAKVVAEFNAIISEE